jgi:hypothetical protein
MTLRTLAKTIAAIALAASASAFPGAAVAQELDDPADNENPQTAPGVNPKDNITKAEVIFQHDNLENGVSVTTMALKYDIAFDANWGANIELPISNLRGPVPPVTSRGGPALLVEDTERPVTGSPGATFDAFGIGDLRLRSRNVRTHGRVSVLSAVELVVPTATDDLIGTGKWQINPVVGAVYAFDQQTFAFAGYKHYFSIAGDDQREDINRSEGRALFARLFTNATWVLGDIKYSKSHTGLEAETLDLEGEYGTMLSRSVALSGRVGTSFLDSQRQFGLSLNLRKIF